MVFSLLSFFSFWLWWSSLKEGWFPFEFFFLVRVVHLFSFFFSSSFSFFFFFFFFFFFLNQQCLTLQAEPQNPEKLTKINCRVQPRIWSSSLQKEKEGKSTEKTKRQFLVFSSFVGSLVSLRSLSCKLSMFFFASAQTKKTNRKKRSR